MEKHSKDQEQKPETIPANSLVDVYATQQEITLNKLKEDKNATNATNDGDAIADREHLGGDSRATEDPDSEQREEPADDQSPNEGS